MHLRVASFSRPRTTPHLVLHTDLGYLSDFVLYTYSCVIFGWVAFCEANIMGCGQGLSKHLMHAGW